MIRTLFFFFFWFFLHKFRSVFLFTWSGFIISLRNLCATIQKLREHWYRLGNSKALLYIRKWEISWSLDWYYKSNRFHQWLETCITVRNTQRSSQLNYVYTYNEMHQSVNTNEEANSIRNLHTMHRIKMNVSTKLKLLHSNQNISLAHALWNECHLCTFIASNAQWKSYAFGQCNKFRIYKNYKHI